MSPLISLVSSYWTPVPIGPRAQRRRTLCGKLSLLLVLVLVLVLTACAKPTFVLTECIAFDIIRPSRLDTKGTLEQVAEHNAAWRASCESR
jgi:hypothetical protein